MVNKSGKNKSDRNNDDPLDQLVTLLPKGSGTRDFLDPCVAGIPDFCTRIDELNNEYISKVKLTKDVSERKILFEVYLKEITKVFDKLLKPYRDAIQGTTSRDIFSAPELYKKISEEYDIVHPMHPETGLKYISNLKKCHFCGHLVPKRNKYCNSRCELNALRIRRNTKKRNSLGYPA